MSIDTEKLRKEFSKIAKESNIMLAILFGSQANGKTHRNSDVDIAVLTNKILGPMELARLGFEITQKLKIGRLEIVDLRQATPLLLKEVALKSVLLYEKEKNDFSHFKIQALKLFMETKHFRELRDSSLNKFLYAR